MWEGIADRYEQAGWWERRWMDLGVFMYLVTIYLMVGLAILIEKARAAWRIIRG